jgi:protein O-mannosyl-transferase
MPLKALILFPALAAAVLYLWPATHHDFVSLDDSLLITKNPAVMEISGRSLKYIVTHYDPELYIPLTFFSYQIDDLLWGQNPVGFHLTNVLLHAVSAALLTLLTWKLSRSRFIALTVGLLFALHPLNVETVLWASARKDALSSCLALASALCFVQFRQQEERRWHAWSVVLFLLALLAKVSVVTLPAAFALFDLLSDRRLFTRERIKEYLPYAVLAIVFVLIALYGKSSVLESTTPFQTFLFASKSAVFYLLKLFVPSGLTAIYLQRTPVTIASPEFFFRSSCSHYLRSFAPSPGVADDESK